MSSSLQAYGLDRLSVAERFAVMQDLWDSIAEEIENAPLTQALKEEVNRRLAAHRANPQAAIPWEQVESEALARLRQ